MTDRYLVTFYDPVQLHIHGRRVFARRRVSVNLDWDNMTPAEQAEASKTSFQIALEKAFDLISGDEDLRGYMLAAIEFLHRDLI